MTNWIQASDFPTLNEAFDNALETGHTLFIPKGIYELDEPIIIDRNSKKPCPDGSGNTSYSLTVIGDWPVIRLKESACDTSTCIRIEGPGDWQKWEADAENSPNSPRWPCYPATHWINMSRLLIDARHAEHGIETYKVNDVASQMSSIAVVNAKKAGFYLDTCQSSVWQGCYASNCGTGFFIVDCNAAAFNSCRAYDCCGHGFVITSCNTSGGCTLNNPVSENNEGIGIHVLRFAQIKGCGAGCGKPSSGICCFKNRRVRFETYYAQLNYSEISVSQTSSPWTPVRIVNGWLEQNKGGVIKIDSFHTIVSGCAVGIKTGGNTGIQMGQVRGCSITGCSFVSPGTGKEIAITGNVSHNTFSGNYLQNGQPVHPVKI